MQENIVATILFLVSLQEEFQVVLPNLIVVDAGLIASWESELKLWTTQVDFINYTSESTDAREFIQQAEFNFPNGPIKPQMILTTFEVLNSDMEILKTLHWEVLVVSELKSYYRPFSQIKAEFRLLLLSEPLKVGHGSQSTIKHTSQEGPWLMLWSVYLQPDQDSCLLVGIHHWGTVGLLIIGIYCYLLMSLFLLMMLMMCFHFGCF
jgi:hypothetical protein